MKQINKVQGLKSFAVLTVCAGVLGGCHYAKIEPASVGILFDANSGISQKILKPQMTVVGIRQQLITYPTSIKNASFVEAQNEGQKAGEDSIKASTVEGAQLPVDVTVAWHVDPANVVLVFQSFGTADQEEMTDGYIRYWATYAVNCVSGQKSIFDLMAKDRQSFGPLVKQFLAPIMSKYGISVDDVLIGEVHPPKEISDKAQERIARRNDLENAKLSLEKAKRDSVTIITNAERDAQLNQIMAQMSDTAKALRKQDILKKAIEKWDGKAPLVGNGTIPFTNIQMK
jgi:regulator of protease activity HflC (stomatin/prohibitin superfamily)